MSGKKHQDGVTAATSHARPEAPAGEPLRLTTANINPTTGLATDYLNHFNEAIMLLEILPSGSEFRDDFLRWKPESYREHFSSSPCEGRNAAIAAYEDADPRRRSDLEALTDTMTKVLTAAQTALRAEPSPARPDDIVRRAVATLKPLVARAGALINGETYDDGALTRQTSFDDVTEA